MSDLLLIDYRRSFLDGRPCLHAHSSKQAIDLLTKNEGKIKSIWMDYEMGPGDDIRIVLNFLALRAKLGMHYPVKVINVHTPSEAGWQVISSKLNNLRYIVRRESIRETLGGY
jgi:hypothetical protein